MSDSNPKLSTPCSPWRRIAARAAGVGLLLAVLAWVSPPADPVFRACPFHWLTGLPCPLCGLTRGVCALVRGHCSQALQFNALSPLGLVLLLSLFWNARWRPRLWMLGIAAFAVYGVCRIAWIWMA